MIPDYQSLMKPVLNAVSDGNVHAVSDVIDTLAVQFSLSPDECNAMLPNGKQTIFSNRIRWAKTYLHKAKLIEYVKRGHFKITERGRELLEKNDAIDNAVLKQYPEFIEFMRKSNPVIYEDNSPL